MSNWTVNKIGPQNGKSFLITGASSGVGLATAKAIVGRGGTVIMAVRNLNKGEQVRSEIVKNEPEADVHVMQLNLSDLDSVKRFIDKFSSRFKRLDVLINNAGLILPNHREETVQGFEAHFGTNHLGHFALTAGLFEVLLASSDPRIVTVASLNPKFYRSEMNWEDLQYKVQYNGMEAYTQSKLANIMFALELDRKLKKVKSKAKSIVTNPGFTRSGMQNDMGFFTKLMSLIIAQSTEMGMLPQLRAAVDKDVQGGEFFSPNKMREMRGYPELITPPEPALNISQRDRLWKLSEQMTGVKFKF